MIKLDRNFSPVFLNPKKVNELKELYKNENKSVWQIEELKILLLSLTFNKCSYCECKLSIESKYMEIDHFEDKNNYPDRVIDWDNLLPSCKRCNGSKSDHDVLKEPIVNPFITNPKDHLIYEQYRFYGRTKLGELTKDVLDLNNFQKVVAKRFDIGNALIEQLEILKERVTNYNTHNVAQKNRIVKQMHSLLFECQPDSEYGSTTASILFSNGYYNEIKILFNQKHLWNPELEKLECEAKRISYK